MATGEHRPSTRRRYRLIGGALIIWVVVVMAAAGSAADDSLLGVEGLEAIWIIGLALMALAGLILLIVLNPFHGEWTKPQQQRRFGGWIVPLIVLALVIWKPDVLPNFEPQDGAESGPADLATGRDVDAEGAVETVAQLSDLLLLLAAAAVIGAVAFLLRGRVIDDVDLDAEAAEAELEADLAVALQELTAELEMGADPRSAVLAAYAVLESVLSEHGLERARSETPTEHLQRSLARLRIDAGPLVQLGQLYEVARFSDLAITNADQQNALRSLEQARADLAGLI